MRAVTADESAADRWFFKSEDKKHGPVSIDELRHLFAHQTIPAESPAWRHGMEAWTPAAELPELQGILPAAAPRAIPESRLRNPRLTVAIAAVAVVLCGMIASQIGFRAAPSPPPPSSLTEQLIAIGRSRDLASMPIVVTAITNPDTAVATTAVTVAESLLGVRYSDTDRDNLFALAPKVQADWEATQRQLQRQRTGKDMLRP